MEEKQEVKFKISGTEGDLVNALSDLLHTTVNLRDATKKYDGSLSDADFKRKVVMEQKTDQIIEKYLKK